MEISPLVLLVLDGWGRRDDSESNAIQAGSPYFHDLLGEYPNTLLTACGREVGLPIGVMGNSEVGHTNLGAGRVVYQDVSRIDKAIEDGEFQQTPALVDAIEHARRSGTKFHLVGLLTTGMVHASDHHLRTILRVAADRGLPRESVCIHVITDGRDTPPLSGAGFIETLEATCSEARVGRIVSVIGRYFAMDRDKRWDRIEKAYDLFVHGEGEVAESAGAALRASYAKDVTDEFVEPVVIAGTEGARVESGDAVFLFNYRADRMRQITDAFTKEDFDGFDRSGPAETNGGGAPGVHIASMTRYRDDFSFPVRIPTRRL